MDRCKKCGNEVKSHYAGGYDIWTCRICGISAESITFYDFFEDDLKHGGE